MGAVPPNRQLNGIQQVLRTDGLGQKFHGAGLHGSNRHLNIGVAADEDDGSFHMCLEEFIVKIQAALTREPDIKDKAADGNLRRTFQEFLR